MSDINVTARLSDGIHATAQIANVVEIPVAPDVYTGEYNIVAPSEGGLTLPTKDKLMMDDVTIESLKEWTDPVLIADETLTANATQKAYSTLPNGEQFKFDRITVEFSNVMQNNNGFRTYYNRGVVIGNPAYGMIESVRATTVRRNAYLEYIVSDDGSYIDHNAYEYAIDDEFNKTYQSAVKYKVLTGGLEAITTWAWWGCTMYEDSRFIIKGYNRIKQ